MMRFNDWEKRLSKTFEEWNKKKFIWGVTDCCWFASSCVKSVRGDHPVLDFIRHNNEYETEGQAQELMKKFEANILGCIISRLGEPKKPLLAQRGDVVLLKLSDLSSIKTGKYFFL